MFEVLKDVFAPFMDGEKKPLHAGEVMNLWLYLHSIEDALRMEQIAYNTTQDSELKGKLEDLINNIHKPVSLELQGFLRKEGVPIPPSTPEKPYIPDNHNQSIPECAKMSDEEISSFIVYKLVLGIQGAARGITESVRADVGAMFSKYFMTKVMFSLTFKKFLEKKGWLSVPPYYKP